MPNVCSRQFRNLKQSVLTCLPCKATKLPVQLLFAAGGLLLNGCSNNHKDFVDNSLDWTQKMRGGIIATQRPPPPGANEPYPNVGLVPTTVPPMPSPEARALLTEQLIRDKNLTHRTEAANGTLTPDIPPPPSARLTSSKNSAAPALAEGQNGAVMDAATAPPQTEAKKILAPQSKAPAAPQQEAELAMPEVTGKAQALPVADSDLPQIAEAPPAVPSVAGINVPSDALIPDEKTPDYDLADPTGTALHFMPGSDQLSAGQDSALIKLVGKTPQGPFYVRASGSSVSLSASDQADAVQLGLLRAQRVASQLIALHVPANAIHIRAESFGSGAHVSTTP